MAAEKQLVGCRKRGSASDAAGAASILASLVSLRVVTHTPADEQSSPVSRPEDDEEDIEGGDQDIGIHRDADGEEGTAEEAGRPAPLLKHPGVEVDPEAHGPALRELSKLFSSGTGMLTVKRRRRLIKHMGAVMPYAAHGPMVLI